MNGTLPVSIWYVATPSPHTSVNTPTSAVVRICSGAMYSGVPSTTPLASASPSCFAIPKSSSFTKIPGSPSTRKRLSGFTSQWTTPAAWAFARARAVW